MYQWVVVEAVAAGECFVIVIACGVTECYKATVSHSVFAADFSYVAAAVAAVLLQ